MKKLCINLLSIMVLMVACEKDKTPFTANADNLYTSHKYEWEIDTLKAPGALQVLMRGVWGTDENNVWVVGHSDELKYQLWHWNGERWENHYPRFPGHSPSYKAIYGFSEKDIWVVGSDFANYYGNTFLSQIIHYDGSKWELVEGVEAPFCISIWGSSSSNLFVGTDSGMVLHFDGNAWEIQQTGTYAQMTSIQGDDSQVYAIGSELDTSPYDSTTYYFFEYLNGNWEIREQYIRYPFSPPALFGDVLWLSPERTLYSVGEGLYVWQDSAWIKLRDETLFAIHGTAWNNIFTAGPLNNILHFNGKTWHRYDFFNDYSFDAGFAFWCNDNYVFMTAQLGYQSFVIRGKLKERR